MRLSKITPTYSWGCQNTWRIKRFPWSSIRFMTFASARRKTFYPLWHEVLFIISRIHRSREAATLRLLYLHTCYSQERNAGSRYAICNYDTCVVSWDCRFFNCTLLHVDQFVAQFFYIHNNWWSMTIRTSRISVIFLTLFFVYSSVPSKYFKKMQLLECLSSRVR